MNAPSTAPLRIGVFRLSALGDVVLATALISTLRKAFPAAELTWITSRASHALLKGLEEKERLRFHVVDKPDSLKALWRFRREMAPQRFDVLLAAQASLRANLMILTIRARRKIGFDRTRAKDLHRFFVSETIETRREHLAEGFLGFARALGVREDDWVRRFTVPLDDAIHAEVARWLPPGNFLVVNPAASKAERTWAVERYAEIARRVRRELGWSIVVTGGPGAGERALVSDLARRVAASAEGSGAVIDLGGKTSPKQLAAVLAQASALLAPDTGPVHIARAVGTPVVGLYAVARPALTGPYGAMDWCVDAYPEAARQFLGKTPGEAGWHERVHHAGAMNLITVDAVWEKMRALSRSLVRGEG